MLGPFLLAPWLGGLQDKPSKTTSGTCQDSHTEPNGASGIKISEKHVLLEYLQDIWTLYEHSPLIVYDP